MKKSFAFLLVACLCICLCACKGESSNNNQQEAPQQKPVQYEDTLIEKLKLSDKPEKAEEVFGKPVSDDGDGRLTFEDVNIFGEKFTPTVFINYNYGRVTEYRYDFDGYSNAKSNVSYKKLVDNFTLLYGDPYESDDSSCKWFFEDGSALLVFKTQVMVGMYRTGLILYKS